MAQTIEMYDSLNCRTNRAPQIETDREDMHDGKRNMSDYLRSITTRVADKRAGDALTNKIRNEFSAVFQG